FRLVVGLGRARLVGPPEQPIEQLLVTHPALDDLDVQNGWRLAFRHHSSIFMHPLRHAADFTAVLDPTVPREPWNEHVYPTDPRPTGPARSGDHLVPQPGRTLGGHHSVSCPSISGAFGPVITPRLLHLAMP